MTMKTLNATAVAPALLLAALPLLAIAVVAQTEYDCGVQTVCDPSQAGYLGCNLAGEWGALEAESKTAISPTGGYTYSLSAEAAPVGGNNLNRWIITECSTVAFRPYAAASAFANTYHCLQGIVGTPHPYPCAGVASVWVTNHADPDNGYGTPISQFCGWNSCPGNGNGPNVGTAAHRVTGIEIDVPWNKHVLVQGDASARYYEDRGAGCTLCQESLQPPETDDGFVNFYIGATPPI